MPESMDATVYNALRTAQEKYAYFLLAAAGAAIAFAVNQTHDAKLAWAQLPLAAAVLSWGCSFFFGCLHLRYVSSTIFANAQLLFVQSGRHPKVGAHPDLMAAASEGIRDSIETNSNRGGRYARLQFGFLIAGAVLYLVWHVYEMHLRGIVKVS